MLKLLESMTKDIVVLDYSFIFEAGSPWSMLSQFEGELQQFFAERGLDCVICKGIPEQRGSRVMMISPVTPPILQKLQPTEVPVKKQPEKLKQEMK